MVTASERDLQRASDDDLVATAYEEDRVLVTRDKDFWALVFLRNEASSGVILLRLSPATMNDVHQELGRLLEAHSTDEMRESFMVVEPGRHRVRKLPERSDEG